MGYIPPFSLNDEMMELVSKISENIGRISSFSGLEKLPRLRRSNRIKSIQASLAIENNTLTIHQVTEILNGSRVIGPENEIQEVKNAIKAYEQIEQLNPYDQTDLLKSHKTMMSGLISRPGFYRSESIGVFNEKGQVIHIAPNAYRVSELMNDLFEWLKTSNVHYLIKSSIFHYEFEFIHPFQDGNGRIGRLWQSVILTHWKSIFVWIPIESIIKTKQQEYYDSIAYSNQAGNSNTFILFMLEVILDAVNNVINDVNDHVNHINSQITNLLFVMKDYPLKAKEIMDLLGLKSLSSFKINYLIPALEAGLIKMTIPEKPTSKNQQYYKC